MTGTHASVTLVFVFAMIGCGTLARPAEDATESLIRRLDKKWVAGCVACDGPDQFVRLINVSLTAEGTVLALDTTEPFVRRIHVDGTVDALVGKGEGPGEVDVPRLAVGMNEGQFGVIDYLRQRLHVYDRAGGYLDTVPLPVGRVVGGAFDLEANALYLLRRVMLQPGTPFVVLRIDIETGATVPIFSRMVDGLRVDKAYFLSYARDRSSGRFATGFGEEYEISIHAPDGEYLRDFVLERERRPLSAEETRRQQESLDRNTGGRAFAREFHKHFYFDALEFGPNGDLWVLTHRASNAGPSFDVFDVFSSEGEFHGSVAIDESVKPTCACFVVAEGLLVAAVTDKAGIDRVVAWEIPAGLFAS